MTTHHQHHHHQQEPHDEKSLVRQKVWTSLLSVALPDSRHHYDFSSFIPDFAGSLDAISRLVDLEIYRTSTTLFITPDNCLESLRLQALKDGKTILMTTYGIRRGFWVLDPSSVPDNSYALAATLDGMERFGRHVKLSEIADALARQHPDISSTSASASAKLGLGQRETKIPLLITGTGAINTSGIRFGKGHGFFDLEWSMLYCVGLVCPQESVTVAVVHDCQVLDEDLTPEEFDTVCDFVVTPSRVISVQTDVHVDLDAGRGRGHGHERDVQKVQKPTCGILWDKLQPGMMEDIPPLRELRSMV
ncbi:hypothetical protein RBB50_007789 [Rhinocladiella similis]